MCVLSICMYVHHRDVCAQGGQKRVSDPLELELQGVVNHLTLVLEIKPGFDTREEWQVLLATVSTLLRSSFFFFIPRGSQLMLDKRNNNFRAFGLGTT